MSDDINKEIAKELVSQTAGKTYDDLAHLTAQASGQLISFIPRTIKVWFSKWEKWILNGEYAIKKTELLLAEKLKNIPEDKIVEPEPYVAVPAIQQLSYSYDSEELREMYANLLASSMNNDIKHYVHPSYTDIIKQLSPIDAKVIEIMKKKKSPLPIVTFRLKFSETNSFNELVCDYSDDLYPIFTDTHNMCESLQNLDRLGILKLRYDQSVKPDEIYERFKQDSIYKGFEKEVSQFNKAKIELSKGLVELTEFGESFCKVCCN